MEIDPKYPKVNNDDGLYIEDKLTPLTEAEATYYLREAWKEMFGEYPKRDSIAILWAQSALESFRWASLHCYNFGNVKRRPRVGWTSFKCSEILNGKNEYFYPYHPQTFFVAFNDALEGAIFYLEFLSKKTRYAKAWEQVKLGDPSKYCYELKQAGYFTANLELYTKGVVRLCDEFKKKYDQFLTYTPPIKKEEEIKENPISETKAVVVVEEEKEIKEEPKIVVEKSKSSWLTLLIDILKRLIKI